MDVTIYGAGIFGLSIAWACKKRGAKVQVIDPYGVGAGASGGLVGALAPHVPENWNTKKAFQLRSLLMAERWWQEVEDASGFSSGYGRLGRLQPINDARTLELAHKRSETAKTLWGDAAQWHVEPAQGTWCPQSATGYVIRDTLSARLHPRLASTALAQAVGAVVAEGDPQGIVIEAMGWQGLQALSATMGKTAGNGVKGQALLLAHDASEMPQLFADSLHIIPHANGTTAIGSTSERDFDDPASTDDQLEAVHARALAAFPVLEGAKILERWAGVRPRAKSRAPMLGAHPSKDQTYIANGGFKIGFGMAPEVGEVMADLVLEGHDRIPEGFRVEDNL